ncbi:MAG TPA: ABC transporter permease [Acidimicrobiales bacterium]|nr:ABC transporter permease [Acidimicrobiales bacterium]
MGRYVLRRTLLLVPVVWGAVSVLFVVFFLLPGDPVEVMAGGERAVNTETRAAIEAKYGLDRPWYEQYGRFWSQVAQGDLGISFTQGRSVNDILGETAPASVRLAVWAVAVEVLIGMAAGVVCAVRRQTFVDALTSVSTTIAVAVPVFVLGYLLQYVLGVYTFQHRFPDWARFPVQGIGPDSWALFFVPTGSQWRYLILPTVTLASVSTALVARMTRASMLEVMSADYMRTATAKGLRRRTVVLKHGLRNALVPVVTLVGLDLGALMGSAVLTETVFNWPGMGSAIQRAITSLDAPIVLGLTLVLVAAYVVVNLLVDLSYAFLDPRIRYGKPGAR